MCSNTLKDKLITNELMAQQKKAVDDVREILKALNECDTKWYNALGEITKRILEEDGYPIVVCESFSSSSIRDLFLKQYKRQVKEWADKNNLKIVLNHDLCDSVELVVFVKKKKWYEVWK